MEVWWKSWGLYSTILFFTLLWTLFWCVLFGFSQSLNLCIVAPCFLLTWSISCVLWSTTSCRTEVLPFTGCVDNIVHNWKDKLITFYIETSNQVNKYILNMFTLISTYIAALYRQIARVRRPRWSRDLYILTIYYYVPGRNKQLNILTLPPSQGASNL